ncbi:hypothetical protein EDD16DRAFT_327927 [Pisolithus croceorrhizus]|nr:hypothetical protein EDD16DRAFT_327927 [Pisolithus croceorrhizus]KAI6144861.1 hypothetical protein EDD17DRAFT_144300 [Pisolithus thermaeus]
MPAHAGTRTTLVSISSFSCMVPVCRCQPLLVASCMTADECQAQIPFAGTGITIYVTNAGFQGANASLDIDGTYLVSGTLPPPTPPSYQTPRVSLLAIQSLAYAYHTATLSILDWNAGNTSLYFDYALVEDSNIQTTTSRPSTLATPSLSNAFFSETSLTMFTTVVNAIATTITGEMTTTMGTTAAAASYTSASSSNSSSCTHCLRAIEIAVPCVIGALLITGIIFYLKSLRDKAKKKADSCIPVPYTVPKRSPSTLTPAAEEKARLRVAQSRISTVHADLGDIQTADDH